MEGSTVTYTRNLEYKTSKIKFGWLDDLFVYVWTSDGYIEQYKIYKSTTYRRVLYNRTNIDLLIRHPDNRTVVSIELNDVMLIDDRMYLTLADKTLYPENPELECFHLHVMEELKTKPNGTLEENEPLYVYAPDKPHVNATTLWLLDGLTSDQTALFIQQDDFIWIPQVNKHLDGKNVTFRTILNETVFDNNFTLSVRTLTIQIFPEEQIYIVTVGDKLPVITCSSNCAPACVVSWGNHSSNRLLSLGTATKETNGRYTCTAIRLDSKRKVEISVTVHVQDNNNILMQGILMIVIVGFASGQVLTLLVFGLCVLVVCKRINKLSSKTSSDTATNKQYGANMTEDTVGYQLTTTSPALENYDSLNPNEIYDTAT
ncbi:uncharacterized protein LOC132754757 [Ruditapes philippinarum]|uniref:uncharacterized protein LOC132754757 n=1 Tax=Ruditapes philippinarum TaxID=129788 RepID=UPI00295AB5F4|nr:uncharacterized protein LOC132754757 [Ruditapes philippinarum]